MKIFCYGILTMIAFAGCNSNAGRDKKLAANIKLYMQREYPDEITDSVKLESVREQTRKQIDETSLHIINNIIVQFKDDQPHSQADTQTHADSPANGLDSKSIAASLSAYRKRLNEAQQTLKQAIDTDDHQRLYGYKIVAVAYYNPANKLLHDSEKLIILSKGDSAFESYPIEYDK